MPKPILRNFTFPDSDLKQKADNVAASMDRDQTEFTGRGITALMTTAFETLSSDFGDMDTDEEWIGNVSVATQEKDALAESLKVKIRVIRNMAEIKWTTKSGKYRSYGFEDMNKLSDDKLVRLGRRVIKVSTAQQADLASEGFVAGTLSALTTNVNDFDVSVDTKNNAEKDRDIAQQARVEAANTLYGFLDKYCSIGKTIWAADPAKYNDYVIYPSNGGGGSETQAAGTVTDSITSDPLSGVAVTVDGRPENTVTAADGSYNLPLPAGTYTLIFTIAGYDVLQQLGVVIEDGDTTTVDVDLVPE